MKQLRVAGILLAVLLIMSGVAYWDEEKSKEEDAAEQSKNKLFEFEPTAATKFLYRTVVDGEELQVEGEKVSESEGWRLTSPIEEKADDATIANLTKNVADYKYQKQVSADKSKDEEYGLTYPARIVRLESAEGKVASLHLGNKAVVGYSVYLRDGEKDSALIGSQHILTATSKTLRDFRSKQLIGDKSLSADGVSKIVYEWRNQPKVVLEKMDKSFAMKEPVQAAADPDESRDLIDSLGSQKVEGFIDQPGPEVIASFAPQKLLGKLVWTRDGDKPKTIMFSDHGDQFLASLDPEKLVYKLNKDERQKYEKTVVKLRNRRVFDFDSDFVTRVNLDDTNYERVEKEFYKASDAKKVRDGEEIKPALEIRTLVEDLEFAKTDKFLTTKDVRSLLGNPPQHAVKVWYEPKEGEKKEYSADFFPEESGNVVYVKVEGKDTIYSVPSRVLSSLQGEEEMGEEATEALEPLELDSLSN